MLEEYSTIWLTRVGTIEVCRQESTAEPSSNLDFSFVLSNDMEQLR